MKHPTTTFLAFLFPLLAPTLVFAHARPHAHPRGAAGVAANEVEHAPRLKRQDPVANTTTVDTTTSSSTDTTTTSTTSRPGINLDDILSSIQSGVLGGGETPTTSTTSQGASTTSGGSRNATDDESSSTSSSDEPETTVTSGLTTGLNTPSITIQPPFPVDTNSPSSEDDTSSSSRTQIPIIGTLSDLLTSLLDPEPTTTTSSDTASITTAPSTTTTSRPGLDDVLSSIFSDVSSVVSDITSVLPNATDVTTVLPEPTDLPTLDTTTLLPTDTDVLPTDLPTSLPTNSTIEPTADPTIIPPTDTLTLPTETTTDTLPTETGTDLSTSTLPPANTTVPGPTELPGTSILTETSETSETTIPTETSGIPSETVTTGPVTTGTDVPPSDQETSAPWFGTGLVTASSPTAQTDPDAPGPTETSLPSGVPEAITPPGGVPEEPANSTLVQIGFSRQYNYAFVSDSLKSAAQICEFLPQGLAHGLHVNIDELRMHSLQPLPSDGLDYIVTVALVYIPSDVYMKLATDIHIPLSDLYTHDSRPIADFMKTIDPSIPLSPGSNIALLPEKSGGDNTNDPDWIREGDNFVDGSQATSTSSANPEQGADPYNADGESNTVTSKTVLVGAASVGAAALYGVAMYFLAKRYRNNRLSHRRSQSLSGGGIEPPMSDIRSSGALSPMMSTHFFNNGRTTPTGSDKRGSKGSKTSARGQISAPMMSENSLGWD